MWTIFLADPQHGAIAPAIARAFPIYITLFYKLKNEWSTWTTNPRNPHKHSLFCGSNTLENMVHTIDHMDRNPTI